MKELSIIKKNQKKKTLAITRARNPHSPTFSETMNNEVFLSVLPAQLYPVCEHRSSVGHENSRDKCGEIRHQETVQVCKLELEQIHCKLQRQRE